DVLNQQGYDVLCNNHRGHGKDIEVFERGHIDNMDHIADDTYEIAQTLYSNDTNTPYIILGHSMWTIVSRIFTQKYPDVAQGMILSGTMHYPKFLGKLIPICLKKNTIIIEKRRHLKWLNQIIYKSFNKNIKNNKSNND